MSQFFLFLIFKKGQLCSVHHIEASITNIWGFNNKNQTHDPGCLVSAFLKLQFILSLYPNEISGWSRVKETIVFISQVDIWWQIKMLFKSYKVSVIENEMWTSTRTLIKFHVNDCALKPAWETTFKRESWMYQVWIWILNLENSYTNLGKLFSVLESTAVLMSTGL